ncbi:uncharacterized protein LOC133731483 [Rosa rugosa]|uniref:uncharacterized protein LOC133731483 n=1 Tax=Rosa rugosa TaxID=74645 RepID=UPI002B413775|nr:uncharacterized protein LOC133731483 [Rosa rugosa]
MGGDETVDDFHGRILKITGQCRSLGAPFDEDKIVKKMLRALHEKFHSKVTSIEDSFDIDDYPIDELIGNLKTYEMRLKPEKKNKGVAFKAMKGVEEEEETLDLALLTKEFNNFLKSKNSSRNPNAPRKNLHSGSSDYSGKSGKGSFKGTHYGKTKKHGNSNNKSLLSTWSDDETQEVENVAFVSSLLAESESDEAFSDDETTIRCKQLYKASKATLIKNMELDREVETLNAEKEEMKHMLKESQTAWEQEGNMFTDELTSVQNDKELLAWKTERLELNNKIKVLDLEDELKTTQEKFTKFDISSGAVSRLFGSGKAPHDTFGLGYSGEKSTHIEATCLVALTALADKRRDFWYVDSGCSRHMTGDKVWFSSFEDECTTGSVTFGDGSKASILARGTVNTPDIPNLKNVLYVEGLTSNLISVSHLANDYEDVWFNKQRCLVLNHKGEGIMGVRSTKKTFELWHRRLGHVNYQDMLKLSSKQCVRGMPALNGKTDKLCGGCRIGKQTKAPHKVVNSATTTKALELLLMDLMGSVQSESIGGKSYMLVVVDDFSRFTWVNFLKDKAETFESFKSLSQKMLIEKQSSNLCMVRVRYDNGIEFKNAAFTNYFNELGVSQEF